MDVQARHSARERDPLVPDELEAPNQRLVYLLLDQADEPLCVDEMTDLARMAYVSVYTSANELVEMGFVERRPTLANGGHAYHLTQQND